MPENNQTEIQKIASSCIDRWGEDIKTKNFSGKLGRFISQLDSNAELGTILLELVKHYNYYTRERINKLIVEFYNVITEELELDENYTMYSRIEKDAKINSSNFFLEEFKIANDISCHNSYDIEKLDIGYFDYIENVVFLDDIIGTGSTVEKFFNKYRNKLSKVNCYIFCIEILDEGKIHLEKFFKDNSLTCKIIPHKLHKKAFSENHIFSHKYGENEKLLMQFEIELWGNSSANILGFDNSQAIVSFFKNTPNNTISSFWYEGDKWKGLFPRDDRVPAWKKTANKERKKKARYNSRKIGKLKHD